MRPSPQHLSPLLCAITDPLLILATVVGLVPATSFDDAYDGIEKIRPGFYRPEPGVENYLRSHWASLVPAGFASIETGSAGRCLLANRRIQRFLGELANGESVSGACQVAGLGRSTVYDQRRKNADFARAWDIAESEH